MRHGHTALSEAHVFYGRLDPPLSLQGEAEACRTALSLGEGFDCVMVSGAKRALQTAEIVCPGLQTKVMPELREVDFGDFEGLKAEEIEQLMPEVWAEYMADPLRFTFPGGDSAESYLRSAQETALALARGEGRVLAVSHKGFIATALSALLHGDVSHMFQYDIRPAGFARLRISEGFAVLTQLF